MLPPFGGNVLPPLGPDTGGIPPTLHPKLASGLVKGVEFWA